MWCPSPCIVAPLKRLWRAVPQELEPDRWCSHAAWGQEAWQIVAQWTWTLRLEVGHQLAPELLRTTEFAPALSEQNEHAPHTPSLTCSLCTRLGVCSTRHRDLLESWPLHWHRLSPSTGWNPALSRWQDPAPA
jgi:hypothetical protein